MAGCKNQLIMKYHSKLLVSNICYIEFIMYITKFTTVNILGGILYQEIQTTTSTYKVSIKFWQNISEELFKIEYLIILSQYFGNITQEFFVVSPHECLCKISKLLAEFNKVFNFEKSPIYILPKFNRNLMCASSSRVGNSITILGRY